MPATRTKEPLLEAFGGVLRQLRDRMAQSKGSAISHDALARIVTKQSAHLSIAGPTLWRWEEGEVRSPDPLVLRALAKLFGVEFPALIDVLDANRANPGLSVEDAFALLESHGAHSSHASPDPSIAPDQDADDPILGLAARLIDTGDQLYGIAESILGRYLATAGDPPATRNDADSPPRTKTAR